MSHWDFGRTPAEQHDAALPAEDDFRYGPGEVTYHSDAAEWPELTSVDAADDLDDADFGPYPITYERGRVEPDAPASAPAGLPHEPHEAYDPYGPYEIWPPAPAPDDTFAAAGDRWQDDQWQDAQPAWPPQPPRSPRSPRSRQPRPGGRWLIPAGVAVAAAAIGGATVLLTSGHPGGAAAAGSASSPASAAPATPSAPAAQSANGTLAPPASAPATGTQPLTMAQAERVLAAYTAGNNRANAVRSTALLAGVETGGSYAVDAGLYLTSQAAGAAPYPAFEPVSADYYIPGSEPAAGSSGSSGPAGPAPRWFAVKVSNAFRSSPEKVSSVEYLVFTQATAGGPWQDAIEPYLLPAATAPRVAVSGGLATSVAVTTGSLSIAPGQLPGRTAAALGGDGSVIVGGILADHADRQFWREKLPTATVTDTHAPATGGDGETFALRTADGGALVFYTDAADLTITPPQGELLRLNVPGLYSPAMSLHRAGLAYLDQFAAYDPPAGSGPPRVVAEYSGITGKA